MLNSLEKLSEKCLANRGTLQVVLLLLLHVFLFNVLFTYRDGLEEGDRKLKQFLLGEFKGGPLEFVKFCYSHNSDEVYYYEWSSIVLGKPLGDDYYFIRGESSLTLFYAETPRYRLPYRDVPFEYPPLAMVPLLLARLISFDYLSFTRAYAFVVSLGYFAALLITYFLWRRLDSSQRMSWRKMLFCSAGCILALGQIYVLCFDVFPSVAYLLALYLFVTKRYRWSAFWIAGGFFLKAYSVLLAPFFGMVLLYEKKYKELFVNVGIVLSILIIGNIGFGLATDGAYWETLRYHSARGIQIESLYALMPFILHFLIPVDVFTYYGYGSTNIWMPGIDVLVKMSGILLPLSVGAICIVGWRLLNSRRALVESPLFLLRAAALLLLAFILTFKVFSPQFLIWLTPLIFLMQPSKRGYFFFLLVLIFFLTQLIFPVCYGFLTQLEVFGMVMLAARNFALVFLFFWILRDWLAMSRRNAAS